MPLDSLRLNIKTILEGTAGIGRVHDYMRFTKRWSEMISEFKATDGKINSVQFARSTKVKRQRTIGEIEIAQIFNVNFIYGLNDADESEKTFQEIIDGADQAIEAYETTWIEDGITCHPDWGPMNGAIGLQVDSIDHRLFGDVLCHFAACRLCLVEVA